MKISIITPAFNSERFIEDCIRSVMAQQYDDFEHIIVDGGSTDSTIAILKRYPHIRWISEKDRGQSDALNKALGMVTGDVVGWLNSDDVYTDGTFQKVSTILSDPKVSGVYSNCYFVDEELNIKRKLIAHRPSPFLSRFHCFIPSTTFFFKRAVIDAGIRFDIDFDITMDKEFFAQIIHSGFTLVYSNDFFAKFRWHGFNKSLNTSAVKRTIAREGITILARYGGIRLSVNRLSIVLYRYTAKSLKIYKNILRILDRLP